MPDIGQPHLFEPPPSVSLTLQDRFLVPPFSVLEARAGYWQKRKQEWVNLGIRGELGREGALLAASETAAPEPSPEDAELAAMLGITTEAAAAGIRSGEGRPATPSSTPVPSGSGAGMSDTLGGGKRGRGTKQADEYAAQRGLEGRANDLLQVPRPGYGGEWDATKGENAWGGAGTSIFDPVLCELVYRWFCPAGGHVLDPFAGGSVRGIVAAHLELAYTGIDLSPQQVQANEAQRDGIGAQFGWPHQPRWVLGDAVQPHTYREVPEQADLIFTCPPYYDLEVYSDDPNDLSAMGTYEEFLLGYRLALKHACSRLRNDRFAVVVVGEVRNKKSMHYVGLVPDTIKAMEAAGMSYYNEGILVTSVGSLPIRTSALFGPGRKLGKTHQNILGFVKGDWKAAAKACPMPAEIAVEYGGATFMTDGTVKV